MIVLTDKERQKLLILLNASIAIPSYDREEMLALRRKIEGADKRIVVETIR